MHNSTTASAPDATGGGVDTAVPHGVPVREWMIVEQDPMTGVRLKYYSQAADVEYWTALWKQSTDTSYVREKRGHLPHQLRHTFGRWAKPNGRTLEAGCGLGHFTVAAHALGYRAEGLDWSADTVDQLRRQFPSIPWHVGDVRSLEFSTGSFDTVYSPGVCEHFTEGPWAILAETRRILRPGGVAVISTPCFNAWMQRRAESLTRGANIAGVEFYQYAFTPDGMRTLLERLGFEVVQVRPYAALDTLIRYDGWRVPARLTNAVALAMDYVPVVRDWGSTCIWVARKC